MAPEQKGNGPSRPGGFRFSRTILIWVLVGILIYLFFQLGGGQGNWGTSRTKVTYTEIQSYIVANKTANNVKSLIITDSQAVLRFKEGGSDKEITTNLLPGENGTVSELRELASDNNVPVSFETEAKWPGQLIAYVLPLILILALFYFFFYRPMRQAGAGGVLSFGKSRARLASKEHTGVTFDDVAGIEEAKEEVREIIDFLKNPKKFQRLGARIPRGILLVGLPGSGKTLLAKAIAGEADVPFYSISGSDFVEMFVGVGASRVRDLFQKAKENAPCIIFLDEIDAVGRRRGHGWGGGHDEREQTLNAILVEMDGFETDEKVIVIAATNRPDVLDSALLRPGRFDRAVNVDLPDVRGREAILRVHAKRVKLGPDADLSQLARGTPMFSGADLEAIINEAAIRGALRNAEAISMADLLEARDKIRWGRQKRSRVMDEEDKRITAYHEAGHALLAKLMPEVEPLHRVTIIPRGMALGATMQLPERDRYMMQRKRLRGTIMMLYGGRIAEEMFCSDISTGAQNDLKEATQLARRMVREFGMSENLGPVSYADSEEKLYGGEVMLGKEYSEATAGEIDQEVRRIMNECYRDARQLLQDQREKLDVIAKALLKYETLEAEDMDDLLAGRLPQHAIKVEEDAAKEKAEADEKKRAETKTQQATPNFSPHPRTA